MTSFSTSEATLYVTAKIKATTYNIWLVSVYQTELYIVKLDVELNV